MWGTHSWPRKKSRVPESQQVEFPLLHSDLHHSPWGDVGLHIFMMKSDIFFMLQIQEVCNTKAVNWYSGAVVPPQGQSSCPVGWLNHQLYWQAQRSPLVVGPTSRTSDCKYYKTGESRTRLMGKCYNPDFIAYFGNWWEISMTVCTFMFCDAKQFR